MPGLNHHPNRTPWIAGGVALAIAVAIFAAAMIGTGYDNREMPATTGSTAAEDRAAPAVGGGGTLPPQDQNP